MSPAFATFALFVVIAQSYMPILAERKEAEILIGAVIPVHKNDNGACGQLNYEGLAVSEAIRFAIDEINKDDKLLGALTIDRTLGFDIQDTCGSSEKEKDVAYKYNGVHRNYKESQPGLEKPVSAVIGEFKKESSEALKLLNFEKIPQLSYAPENAKLKPDGIDIDEVSGLLSVYPEDVSKGNIVVSLLGKLNIEFTTLIARNSERGKKSLKLIQDGLAKANRCYSENDIASSDDDIKKFVRDMSKREHAKVIVVCGDVKDTVIAMDEAERLNLTDIVWISTESMKGKKLNMTRYEEQVSGMIYIESHDPSPKGFDAYMKSRDMNLGNQSKWMKEALVDMGGEQHCTEVGRNLNKEQQEACEKAKEKVENEILKYNKAASYAIDAVYTIANGWQEMKVSKKSSLLECMKKEDFQSPLTESKIQFNADGQTIAESYAIYNIQGNTSSSMKEVEVAGWKRDAEKPMKFNMDKMLFKDGKKKAPKSKCSRDCMPGEEIMYPVVEPQCCWSCKPCPKMLVSNETNSKCFKCEDHQVSNLRQTSCKDFRILHMKLRHPISEFAIFLLTIGLLFTFFTMFIFNQNKDCEVMIMADNETMQALLLGVIVVFASSIVLIFKPSVTVCIAYTVIFNIGLTIIFSAMISKTWVFRQIFYGQKEKPTACCSKPGLFTGLFIVVIEAAIIGVGLYLENVSLLYDDTDQWDLKYIECSVFRGMVYWVAYGFTVFLSVLVNFLNCGVPNVEGRFGEYKWQCLTTCVFFAVAFFYIVAFWAFPLLHKIEVGIVVTILHGFVFLISYIYPKLHMVLFMEKVKMEEVAKSEKVPLYYDDDEEEPSHSPTSGIDVFKNRIVQLNVESDDGKSSEK